MTNKFYLLIVFSVCLSLCLSDNYNLEFLGEKVQESKDYPHGAATLFSVGFLRGLEIFRNVTHKNECLVILPVVHDDWVEVHAVVRNVTDYKSMLEAIKFVITKLEKLEKDVDKVRPDCNIMFNDLKMVVDRLKNYFMKKEKMKLVFSHLFNNIGSIIGKWEMVGEELRMQHFYQGGVYAGSLVKFAILWDFLGEK